jgi:hypothetical protein
VIPDSGRTERRERERERERERLIDCSLFSRRDFEDAGHSHRRGNLSHELSIAPSPEDIDEGECEADTCKEDPV